MTRIARRLADVVLETLVPRTKAGACPGCKSYPRACPGGSTRVCCYVGSDCHPSCGCP